MTKFDENRRALGTPNSPRDVDEGTHQGGKKGGATPVTAACPEGR